jgi:protocatechuate 3,4-dioxygenase beta subunit
MDKRLIAILLALVFVGLLAFRQLWFLSPGERPVTGLDTATPESTRETKTPSPFLPALARPEPVFPEAPVGFPGHAVVEGRITTPEGRAIEGAEVRRCERLSPAREGGLFSLPSPRAGEVLALTIASSSGEYRFSDVRAGVYVVTAMAPGYAQDGRETPRLEDNSRQTGIDLVLFPSASIRGVVVDEVGVVVARAEVSATRTGISPLGSESRWTRFEPRLSGPQGRFTLAHLLPGTYRIEVAASGYAPSQKTGVATDGPELRLVLLRGLRLQGRVLDSEERAVAGAEVQIRWSEAAGGGRAGENQLLPSRPLIANRYGNFQLEGVPRASAGTAVEIHAMAHGYSSVSWSLPPEWDEARAQREQIRLVLQPGAVLKGSVVDRFGAPVPGASIARASGGGAFERSCRSFAASRAGILHHAPGWLRTVWLSSGPGGLVGRSGGPYTAKDDRRSCAGAAP